MSVKSVGSSTCLISGVCSDESQWTSHSSVAAPPAKLRCSLFCFLATANSRVSLSFLTLFLFLIFFFYQPSAFTRRPSVCPRARLSSLLSGASGNKSLAVSRQIPALQRLGERRSSRRVVTAGCERGARTTLRSCPEHVAGNVFGRGRGLKPGLWEAPVPPVVSQKS